MEKNYDVTIIGGGPVGMFAAFYCGLHQLSAQLVESLPQLGGQLTALYPEKQIWDVAGLPGITAAKLVDQLKQQLAIVDVDQFTGEKVTDVVANDDGTFTIQSANRTSQSKGVLIALGNGAFHPRQLRLAGADDLTGQQVHYFVRHKADFAGQRVAVLGGGNSALDNAKMLAGVAEQVTLIHRRDQFRGHELVADQLREMDGVEMMTPFLPRDLVVNDDQSLTLTLKKMRSDEERQLTVDRLVVNYGFTSNNDALGQWSLQLASDHHQIKVDQQMATNIPGVYAIGDAVAYPGRTALIATGFGEAPIAVSALAKRLYPDKSLAVHSSSLKIQQ